MIIHPTKNDVDPKGSYLLGGEKLKNMLNPAEWVDGVKGEIAITEQPDGSISVGFDRSEFVYVVKNGELKAALQPMWIIETPA